VECEPLVASLPLHHARRRYRTFALVDDQDSVELPPLAMVLGLALKLTVRGGRGHRDGRGLCRAAAGNRCRSGCMWYLR